MIIQNIRFKWIVLISILVLPIISTAQNMTNKERRRMNLALLDAIEKYETASTFQGYDASFNFLDLFESDSTRIYCDLMDYTSADGKIGVVEYASLMSEKDLVECVIKDVRKTKPILEDDGWHISVSFMKQLNYTDKNGVWFSSNEYYQSDYELVAEFIYNSDEQVCYISNIEGSIDSSVAHLPKKFIVIQNVQGQEHEVYANVADQYGNEKAHKLIFNSFDQTFVNDLTDLIPWSDNIHIKEEKILQSDSYDLINLSYKNAALRAKVYFSHTVSGMYNISSNIEKLSSKSPASEIGVDIGTTFRLGKASQLGVFIGAGYQNSKVSLACEDLSYSLTTSYTPKKSDFNANDQDYTIRNDYSITNVSESVTYKNIVLPVYFELEHRLAKRLYLTFGLGPKFYFNLTAKNTPLIISGSICKSDESNPDKLEGEYSSFLYPCRYALNDGVGISVILSAGLDFNIFKKQIFFSAKICGEFGFKDIFTAPSYGYEGDYKPLVYYHNQDGSGELVATRSLISSVSFKRQAIWIKGGLTFKF